MKSLPATHYHAQQGALLSATKNKCVSFQGSHNFFCAPVKIEAGLKHGVQFHCTPTLGLKEIGILGKVLICFC